MWLCSKRLVEFVLVFRGCIKTLCHSACSAYLATNTGGWFETGSDWLILSFPVQTGQLTSWLNMQSTTIDTTSYCDLGTWSLCPSWVQHGARVCGARQINAPVDINELVLFRHCVSFSREHIPGSHHFDLNECVTPLPTMPRNLPEPGCLTEYAQSLGIDKDTHLVVYDRGSMTLAARVWWTFRVRQLGQTGMSPEVNQNEVLFSPFKSAAVQSF